MMTGMPRRFFMPYIVLALFILLLLMPLAAQAAKINDLWVTGAIYGSEQQQKDADNTLDDSIHWWYSNKSRKSYLFLPAGADLSNMRIWFNSSAETISAGGKTIRSGDKADFLKPGTEIVLDAGNKYKLSVMQSANVPAMFISTESGSLKKIHSSKSNREKGKMVLFNADGSLEYQGPLDQIKGRGNSTFAYSKKPYQIKLGKSTDLYGMGKARTWILLANYEDNSLLRNKIAFSMAQFAGMEYTSQSQAVDLYINNDYLGSYLLCEKVEIGSSRINIANLEKATEEVNEKPLEEYPSYGRGQQFSGRSKGFQIPNNPEDITGGYLLELEKPHRYRPELSGFKTKKGQPVVIKEPEYVSEEQANYISSLIQAFENAIFSKNGIDSASGKHYTELVDLDSLVKKYIMEEISKNFDGNRTSFYLYKPEDAQSTKFYAGPVWDYDIAFGNFENERTKTLKLPTGFIANNDRGMDYYWFPALYKHADFYERTVEIYHEFFKPAIKVLLGQAIDPTGTLLSLDEYAAEMEASAAMNFSRWQIFNTPNRTIKTGKDYPENIAYLKNFLKGRMAFLNENWKEP